MKKLILLIVVVIVVAVGALLVIRFLSDEDTWLCQNGQWVKHGQPSKPKPSSVCGDVQNFKGVIKTVDYDKEIIVIMRDGSDVSLLLLDDTKLTDNAGKTMMLTDFYKTFEVSGRGSVAAENSLNVDEIKVDRASNIVLMLPADGQEVGLPVEISGVARVFENNLSVRIKDKEGNILTEKNITANSPDIGRFGEFKASLNYTEPKTSEGYVEAFNYSAKDGTVENLVSAAVKFKTVESQIIKVFFSNTQKDPGGRYCARTYAVERRIPKVDAPARVALEEMFLGPSNAEAKSGYFSSVALNPKIEIQKLTIENGTAKVDFNDALNMQGGGSCKMMAIRSQIESTLKQFTTVKKVEISVNGNIGEVLQP